MKRKMIAMFLAAAMTFSLTACGGSGNEADKQTSAKAEESDGGGEEASGSDISLAMITDSGDITDQSFNQTTYEACKVWAEANGVDFTYYKPDSDSDEARNASVDQAVAGGANVIMMPGYMFAAAVVAQSDLYPDVKFVALDVSAGDICEKGVGEGYDYNPDNWDVTEYYNTDNVYCCTYQEEISGYMAGYAAVKLGYKHLGFLGGMSVPAVTRFGYGYVQGINDAAKELGIAGEVEVEYVCGGQFYGDADITGAMDTWYGTKGVDSDQAPIIDQTQEGLTVTSAMKGLSTTVNTVLTDIQDGKWSDYAGKIDNLGMVSEIPEENFVQLPTASTQWGDGFTEEDYKTLVKAIYNGEVKISNDISAVWNLLWTMTFTGRRCGP